MHAKGSTKHSSYLKVAPAVSPDMTVVLFDMHDIINII